VGYWYPQWGNVGAHNVSIDDGSSGQTSAIYVGGGSPFHDIKVFSNSAYSRRGTGPVVSIDGAGAPYSNVHVHDNLFVSGARKVLLYADTADARRLTFAHNRWTSCSGATAIQWGERRFTSLNAWRRATGAERDGSGRDRGERCEPGWWRARARAQHPSGLRRKYGRTERRHLVDAARGRRTRRVAALHEGPRTKRNAARGASNATLFATGAT
jgi:hypothetical protein